MPPSDDIRNAGVLLTRPFLWACFFTLDEYPHPSNLIFQPGVASLIMGTIRIIDHLVPTLSPV